MVLWGSSITKCSLQNNCFKMVNIATWNIFVVAISSHDWQSFRILISLMESKLFVASLLIFITSLYYRFKIITNYFKSVIQGSWFTENHNSSFSAFFTVSIFKMSMGPCSPIFSLITSQVVIRIYMSSVKNILVVPQYAFRSNYYKLS